MTPVGEVVASETAAARSRRVAERHLEAELSNDPR
jgi:hypothetical protein